MGSDGEAEEGRLGDVRGGEEVMEDLCSVNVVVIMAGVEEGNEKVEERRGVKFLDEGWTDDEYGGDGFEIEERNGGDICKK